MVVDALLTLCSLHPGHDGNFNAFNPGLLLSAGPRNESVHPYIVAGAYFDSHSEWATVAGGGCRFGSDKFGLNLMIAHVHGSGLADFPVVVVPSMYFGRENWRVRSFFTNQTIGFGIEYKIRP